MNPGDKIARQYLCCSVIYCDNAWTLVDAHPHDDVLHATVALRVALNEVDHAASSSSIVRSRE